MKALLLYALWLPCKAVDLLSYLAHLEGQRHAERYQRYDFRQDLWPRLTHKRREPHG